jgi:DNA-binding transcriptional ArsR family regulator
VDKDWQLLDDSLAPVLDALADPTRRHVVRLLGRGPLRAGELAAATGTGAPAMSRHRKVLLDVGIIADGRMERDARARVFNLQPESLVVVQAWLDQLNAQWEEQLGSFKRHVEHGEHGDKP